VKAEAFDGRERRRRSEWPWSLQRVVEEKWKVKAEAFDGRERRRRSEWPRSPYRVVDIIHDGRSQGSLG